MATSEFRTSGWIGEREETSEVNAARWLKEETVVGFDLQYEIEDRFMI